MRRLILISLISLQYSCSMLQETGNSLTATLPSIEDMREGFATTLDQLISKKELKTVTMAELKNQEETFDNELIKVSGIAHIESKQPLRLRVYESASALRNNTENYLDIKLSEALEPIMAKRLTRLSGKRVEVKGLYEDMVKAHLSIDDRKLIALCQPRCRGLGRIRTSAIVTID